MFVTYKANTKSDTYTASLRATKQSLICDKINRKRVVHTIYNK